LRSDRLARWLAADPGSESHSLGPGATKGCAWRALLAPALAALNELKRLGHLSEYALGGGMGAMRYTEPFATFDLDVFFIPSVKGISAGIPGMYGYLKKMGHAVVKEGILIGGIPVQFLATDPLTEEAVRNAHSVEYAGVKTRIITAEHLVAMAVRTGRKKDAARIEMLCGTVGIDKGRLRAILARHGLTAAYAKITGRKQ